MTDIAGNRTLSSQWNETVQFYGNQNFLEYISVDDQLTSYTYSEFHYRVIQTANWFHSLGIRKGELVALHLHNSPEYLMCWLALAQIGAVSVPLNEHYRLQESKFVLQKCDIHRIIVEPSSLPIYQSNKEDLLLSTIILAWGRMSGSGHSLFQQVVFLTAADWTNPARFFRRILPSSYLPLEQRSTRKA